MMNKTNLFIFLACLFTVLAGVGCTSSVHSGRGELQDRNKRLYQTLDSLIDSQASIIQEKEARIRIISEGMKASINDELRYETYKRLYEEYLAFRFDSAFVYIDKCLELQQHLGNPDKTTEDLISMAHILAVSGIFQEARQKLECIDVRMLTPERRVEYYNLFSELNLYRSEMAEHSPFFMEYIDSTQYYRQLILQIAPKESFDYMFNRATYTCEQGDAVRAIRLLEDYLPSLKPGIRRYSIVTSTLAYFYSQKAHSPSSSKEDKTMQEYYLLLAAISDLKGAILENNSLRELAAILLERGEYSKAYTYLQQSSNDANSYGSQLRSLQVARMSPLINRAYDMERTAAARRTDLLLTVISIIALLLAGTITYILSLIKKHHMASEQINRMNTELYTVNRQLQAINSQMKESNLIKDEYIGRFLELSSNLLHQGEERSKLLNRLARDHKMEDLYNELKSTKALNDAIRLFHQNFDTAFLNIYPDFIEEVNNLMTDDNQFPEEETKGRTDMAGGSARLTTELRVLALIRLGINDNQTIAGILRSSLTTIYTYRSKLKSRAKDKDSFEDNIRRIATF